MSENMVSHTAGDVSQGPGLRSLAVSERCRAFREAKSLEEVDMGRDSFSDVSHCQSGCAVFLM